MDRAFQLKWNICKEEDGMLIFDFVKAKQISKRALTDIKFNGGDILVNSEHVTVRHKVKEGDVLTIIFPEEERGSGLQADKVPFNIVYEDQHCLVINKPPYVPSIPSREHTKGTLANGLIDYYEKYHIPSTVHIVNRLDKDTSGLMLVAKHRFAHSLFSTQQKTKQIHRTYKAVVHGVLNLNKGTITAPIGRKKDSIIEREVCEDGQVAVTHYEVIQRLEDKTLVKLVLGTGRTHQIRVHMSSLGHPLCGDQLYGGNENEIKRQALHSSQLSFWHPLLEKQLTFEAEMPEDMRELLS
ncbi:RluA family pseudouridine synthase [Metabacillus halosaccharovorans]|uniref:RluA family pseudouridine synthase n=1 Tax=Metabacillus halosaccharovorans TaxID=930124 RepID=UPI002040D09A|nr:RluA family pseudouridine synthase [Metabacillus halosaccharovorans]MCM3442372.1 RluA family pseudouridine synthase [Metabacillus halosaccharovorans]